MFHIKNLFEDMDFLSSLIAYSDRVFGCDLLIHSSLGICISFCAVTFLLSFCAVVG